jgi:probable FeS assembly SUF system protein SufT
MREEITISRPCKATQIPSGYEMTLPEGLHATIVQSLGGAYTLVTEDGLMVRVGGEEVSAIGKEVTAAPQVQGEVSKMELENMVWEQLRTCYDPEIPVNIVELGLVYQCDLAPVESGGFDVNVKMTLTAPGCGMGPVLANDVSSKVKSLPGVHDADVQVVFDPVWDRSMMSEAARLQLGLW